MPNQPYTHTPAKGKLLLTGIDLKHPPDLMPQGKAPYLLNVTVNQVQGALIQRAGLRPIGTTTAGNLLHSIVRLNAYREQWAWFAGAGGGLYMGQGGALGLVGAGYSNLPLALVPLRPPMSPDPWLYVYDTIKQAKYSVAGVERNLGVAPPAQAPQATLNEPQFIDIGAAEGSWGTGGVAVGNYAGERVSPGPANRLITIGQIWFDSPNLPDWACVMPISSTGDYSSLSPGMLITIGGEGTRQLFDIFPAMPSTYVADVMYDAFTDIGGGLEGHTIATIVPGICPPGLRRDAGVVINGQLMRVLSVTAGPDDLYSFRVDTTYIGWNIQYNMEIDIPVTFRVCLEQQHYPGELITSPTVGSFINPAVGTTDQGTVYTLLEYTVDCSQVPPRNPGETSRPITSDDYFHASFYTDQPSAVVEAHFMLDVDSHINDFAHNMFYYVVRQNDFQQLALGNIATTDALLNALTNQVVSTYPIAKDEIQFAQTPWPAAQVNQFGIPISQQMTSGTGQWFEVMIHLSDLTRVGSDRSVGLWGVKAIGVQVIAQATCNIQFGGWWIGGGYGPDCNYNGYGNQGTPILYRYRYRSSQTGAFSEVSPAMRNGILAQRSGVLLGVVASPDPQVDLIDIERNGGTFDTWHRCLTVPNQTGNILDDVIETVAMAGDPLELLHYQPWPVTDIPRQGYANITGARVERIAGDFFNVNWIRGVEVIINNKTYTIFAPPYNDHVLELAENAGALHEVVWLIPEATIAAQPLPYACEGPDGRVFATGDPMNPGFLYFSQPFTPDSASDQGYIEITSPSDPLNDPVFFEGAIYVFSNQSAYRVEASPGQANPYAAVKLGSTVGQSMPYCIDARGPAIFYRGLDGIYALPAGGASQNITNDDLYQLMPFESRQGSPVGVAGQTLWPPDDSVLRWGQHRIAWANGQVFYNYPDQNGEFRTLCYTLASKGWVPYEYTTGGAIVHYEEEGVVNPMTLVGDPVGRLHAVDSSYYDDIGGAFTAMIVTPADDQGDSRATKQYGDVMIDAGLGPFVSSANLDVTVWYDNFNSSTPEPVNLPQPPRDQYLIPADADGWHRNIALSLSWSSKDDIMLWEWQPSFMILPETQDATAGRPTDWMDAGTAHYKFVHGLRLFIDTQCQAIQFQIEYGIAGQGTDSLWDIGGVSWDSGAEWGPIGGCGNIKGPIITAFTKGQDVVPISFPPFKAHLMRLVPIGSPGGGQVQFRLLGMEWEVDPEPEPTPFWVTQATTFDLGGYLHMRDLQFAYATTGPGTNLSIAIDGVSYPLATNLPSTNGVEVKQYFVAPPAKGKLLQLTGIGPGLQIYRRDCEFRIKSWGAQRYEIVRGFGDDTRLSTGARM